MPRIVIEPVTRIEGHAQITLALDREGRVRDARVEVMELRGLEAICVGRPIREMPALTARICGICPVAHSLAAAKAGDEILGAHPPPAARALRRLVLLSSLVQSHATSFFYLAAPDFVFGHGARPALRNVFSLAAAAPDLARDGVLLRRYGQDLVERIAGRRVHPAYVIPGGVTHPLAAAVRDHLLAGIPPVIEAAERTLAWWTERLPGWAEEAAQCAGPEASFLAHAGAAGELEYAEGGLRVLSARGEIVEDAIAPADCLQRITERPVPWSYAKLCAWRGARGEPCAYQVGPLARLNAAARCGTPRADRALSEFRRLGDGTVRSSFHSHSARLVEILAALESIAELLTSHEILSREVLASGGVLRREGVGACEAPRGALFHRYRVDEHGIVTSVDIVAPTGQNARVMNAAVRHVARQIVRGERMTPALRNRVAATVRAFDPCLSCATHTFDGPGVQLRLVGPGGEVLDEWPPTAIRDGPCRRAVRVAQRDPHTSGMRGGTDGCDGAPLAPEAD